LPMSNVLFRFAARSPIAAMERVYRRGWSEVLVQYRDTAELLGNA
jgi:hypothetical protein